MPCGRWRWDCDIATYTDFLRIHGKADARLRRLYWVYGEEELFRTLTTQRLKELANVPVHNIFHVSAYDMRESEIWALLNQHPLDLTQPRLLIVHEAQRLKHLDRPMAWLKDNQTTRSRSATVIFVSSDSGISEEVEELSRSSSAMTVKCVLPKDEDDRLKRAREVILGWSPSIEPVSASALAKRVNFDMGEAYAVVQKAALFPDFKLTVRAVQLLAPRRADDDLVKALVACSKRAAVEALPDVGPESVGRVIGQLCTHVEALSRINSTLTSNISMRETAKRLSLKEGHVRLLYPHARFYPRREAVRRLLLLNRVDSAWLSGARTGVLETLIASW